MKLVGGRWVVGCFLNLLELAERILECFLCPCGGGGGGVSMFRAARRVSGGTHDLLELHNVLEDVHFYFEKCSCKKGNLEGFPSEFIALRECLKEARAWDNKSLDS